MHGLVIRVHGLVIRAHGLIFRAHRPTCHDELVNVWSPSGAMQKIITLIRAHGLIIRAHGLLSHAYGLLSRVHGLARLNNYFPHGTAGAPYECPVSRVVTG